MSAVNSTPRTRRFWLPSAEPRTYETVKIGLFRRGCGIILEPSQSKWGFAVWLGWPSFSDHSHEPMKIIHSPEAPQLLHVSDIYPRSQGFTKKAHPHARFLPRAIRCSDESDAARKLSLQTSPTTGESCFRHQLTG